MSAYHPETLCLSTLRGWAKRLSAGAPDIVGLSIPLNQSQALIAYALGYQDWHEASVVLKPNGLHSSFAQAVVPSSGAHPFPSVNCLFRLVNFSLAVGSPLVESLDALIRMPLPVALVDMLREARSAADQPTAVFVDVLAHLLGASDRDAAVEFKLMSTASSLGVALGLTVRTLPPVVLAGPAHGSPPGISLDNLRSWLRRISMALQSNVDIVSFLKLTQKVSASDDLGSPEEMVFTTEVLKALDAGETLGSQLCVLANKIQPWDPWFAIGLTVAGTLGESRGDLSWSLRHLGDPDWSAVN